jgi:hypothetical protein
MRGPAGLGLAAKGLIAHMVKMSRRAAVALMFVVAAACGDSPVQPSSPPAPVPTPATDSPAVRLIVRTDDSGARDAVAGLSEVVVDASASTGTGPLTFAVDFGDGSKASGATARHVYAAPGTFSITAEAKDSQGRTASASQQVVTKTLLGAWFHAGFNPSVHRVEVRRLEITDHQGQTVRGVYKGAGVPDRAFTGTLTAPRTIRIVADDTTLEGVIPGRLNEESEPWPLTVRGGGYNGDRLEFRAIVGEPTGPPPDADLRIRVGTLQSPVAIVSFTAIEFDGSSSRGSGLSYYIAFGDDQAAAGPRAIHTAQSVGELTARLTVVDRFGRSDSESAKYFAFSLAMWPGDGWFFREGARFLRFDWRQRAGVSYEGRVFYNDGSNGGQSASCSAVLSGERDIWIVVPSLGLEFRGYIDLSRSVYNPDGFTSIAPPMVLTQFGGADNGRTWTLNYDDGPG